MTTHGMTEPSELIALLRQQRDLYERLRELSEKQRNMISGDRPELLLRILRDRQDLVTSLARLNERMGPYRRNWDAAYAALPAELRSEASTLLQEINALLRAVLRTDQEDSALLSAKKQAVAGSLASLSGGQAANTAYARQSGAPADSSADLSG